MNDARAMGEVVGIVIGVIVIVCIFKFANRDGMAKTKYDERQELIRGRGYKYGFYAMMICGGLLTALSLVGIELPMENSVLTFCGVLIGALVQVVYCVWKDAYWGLNNDRKRYMVVFLMIGILNLLYLARDFFRGTLLVEGKLQPAFINFLCSVVFVIIGGELLVKRLVENRKDRE